MKKYLMTGIAALAMCAGFTGCSSHDMEEATPENLAKLEEMKVQQKYEQAFIKAFGQPAANHTWGFGSTKASTRAWNVNGNQWHDGVNYNYEWDAKVTKDEMNKVFNYVNNKNNVETVEQISVTEYWVSQIWNGEDDANASGAKAPTSISYPNQNGVTTTIVGGAQMDKLEIKETTSDDSWIHCNNFNSADNNDWKEGGEGGRTLMTSSGTYSFRYTNSQSSYLSEKYIIVPGEKIDASLAGFYYVCFDFERGYDAKELADEESYGTCEIWKSQATDQNPDAGYWQTNENWTLKGFYNATSADLQDKLEELKGTKVQNITFKGYKNGDKHCDGDGNYTDWIVRISPAKVKEQYDGRIMAEDLSASDDSDFDFNDVVFDWKRVDGGMKIQLRAAGGTLPLNIGGTPSADKKTISGGVEVHAQFGVTSTSTMINTGVGGNGITKTAEPFVLSGINSDSAIKIYVQKNGYWMEIEAPVGKAAAKINVPCTTQWVDEFVAIENAYPYFQTYVATAGGDVWSHKESKYLDLNLSNNK